MQGRPTNQVQPNSCCGLSMPQYGVAPYSLSSLLRSLLAVRYIHHHAETVPALREAL